MNKDLLILVIIFGVIFAGLEIQLVKKKKMNRWILPIIVWTISIIVAIPYSLTLVAFPSLLQALMIICFYIEDCFFIRKNTASDKMKIKNL
ncbi:hypothetical protein [Anaerococcus porci]|uniref:hypothetical protein n=1 Tax=Anaerococcus porci TaxID=2652269 RepID=UPI002A74BCB0|nr:hypothetical protein [Anaerococcus porci]MDY3006070.1 hypothetical protein [Anaerococcus porci]